VGETAYLSLGSNLGDRAANLRAAVAQLALAGRLLAVSAFFVEAEGFISSPDLDSYKTHLADRQKRMSEGGRNGGLKSAKNRGGKQP